MNYQKKNDKKKLYLVEDTDYWICFQVQVNKREIRNLLFFKSFDEDFFSNSTIFRSILLIDCWIFD
jgi:hypothetical protein